MKHLKRKKLKVKIEKRENEMSKETHIFLAPNTRY